MTHLTTIRMHYNTVYLLEAQGGRVLVDTGPDYRGAWDELQRQIGEASPGLVVATHGHYDHAGLGRHWQQTGARVALGRDDHHLARRPPLAEQAELDAFVGFVETSGAPPEVRAEAIAGLDARRERALASLRSPDYPPGGRGVQWPTALRFDPLEPDLAAEDAMIDGIEVIPCPGHTPGNVVVAVPAEGWLFSGDQLLPGMTPTPGIQSRPPGRWQAGWRFPSLPEFVASLQRLQRRQFARCYPGHGDPFDDVAEQVAANLATIEERTARVLAALREAGRCTLYGLCERLYPRALRRRFWQIVATVQGNLDLLIAQGAVREAEGGFEPV